MRINRRWTSAAMIMAAVSAQTSRAEDFFWVGGSSDVIGMEFQSADDACATTYQKYAISIAGQGSLSPYKPPYPVDPPTPGAAMQACPVIFVSNDGKRVAYIPFYALRLGDGCKDDESYEPVSGKCVRSDEDQRRKELGDPVRKSSQGVIVCGNPVNIGAGNKFQTEIDYVDVNGYLRFERYFNGLDGRWRHTYQTALYKDGVAYAIELADGEVVLFRLDPPHGTLTFTPESAGVGTLVSEGEDLVYTDLSGQVFRFDSRGRLRSLRDANARVTNLSYETAKNGDVRTVVSDTFGHTLTITASSQRELQSVQMGDLKVTYAYDKFGRLQATHRNWTGRTTSRTYLYEDPRQSGWLTGIIDERGIRYATWAYDDKGRAVSSEHAGGTEKVTMTYEPDGSVTVANALGHTTRYRYQVVQGMKRIVAIDGEPTAGCPASNTRYTYTTDGQIATKTNALGHVTAYTYDTLGRQTKQVEGQGTDEERTTSTTWDGTSFRPATVTTADRVTSYTYDAQGRPLSTAARSLKD